MLEVDEWIARGWRPFPFRQFIFKLHGRCNLACSYCYVYELADQSWRSRPKKMSSGIVSVAAARIAEHARAHNLSAVRVIFHGGEPLLTGTEPLVDAFRKIRAAVDATVQIDAGIQTNGTLIDEQKLDALEALGIRIGVSLDGEEVHHDNGRRYANKQGSYRQVAGNVELLMKRSSIYNGLLCVIDLESDPVATYEALLRFAPPVIDLLLPHGNWTNLPPGRPASTLTPYADWLITVFDRWYGAAVRETRIRLFDEIMHLLLGGSSATEAVGLTPASIVTIETDGSIASPIR